MRNNFQLREIFNDGKDIYYFKDYDDGRAIAISGKLWGRGSYNKKQIKMRDLVNILVDKLRSKECYRCKEVALILPIVFLSSFFIVLS